MLLGSVFVGSSATAKKAYCTSCSRRHPQLSIYASEFLYLLICLHRVSTIDHIIVVALVSLVMIIRTSIIPSSRIETLPLHQ